MEAWIVPEDGPLLEIVLGLPGTEAAEKAQDALDARHGITTPRRKGYDPAVERE